MSLNNIITSVNALSNNVTIPNSELNNVICLDTANNRIGVKNSNPSYEIDVNGTTKSTFVYIKNVNNNNLIDINSDISLSFSKGLITNDISVNYIKNNIINTKIVNSDISFLGYVDISGEVNMNDSLNIENDLTCSNVYANTVITYSDERLKKNVTKITNALKIIRQLEPKEYDKYNNFNNLIKQKQAGLIAQEVNNIQEISYNVIQGNLNTQYALNYNGIHIYTLSAVKELDLIINELQIDISNIKNKMNNISDLSFINFDNIQNVIRSQNNIINSLSVRLNILENKVNNI